MRKLLQTTAALSALLASSMTANAADVYARPSAPPVYAPPVYAPPVYAPPVYAPPVYAPPPFSWTGFYIGGNIGGAWANRDVRDPFLGVNFNNGNSNGAFIGGGQLGYNWQVGYAVLGIEADFDGVANNNNSGTVFIPSVGNLQVTSNNRWITTLAARFGVTNGPWLFYGKAGGGWVGSDDFTITNLTTGASITGSNNSNSGWLVGAGIEWAFAPNWSAKVEYNFLGLDDRTFIAPVGFTGDSLIERNRDIQMVKVGVNYRFNWGGYGNGYGYR
jgi:outer membrane immunogenic protein